MAAAVVYDGVGGDGTLFAGLKFCFLQRVPLRNRWIELVKVNGGEIVKLEKLANIVIADHARSDSPAGSISWRFIEWSVREGVLEDKDDHRAGPAEHTRPVGSNQPAKKTRTPFTAEDDRVLLEWVVKGERAGVSTKGNELYIQLERKNSRHTSQSWRDRWIKHVSHRPRPNIAIEASPSPSPESTHIPQRSRQQGTRAALSQSPRLEPRDSRTSKTASGLTKPMRPISRTISSLTQGGPSKSAKTTSETIDSVPWPGPSKPVEALRSHTDSPRGPWIAKSVGGTNFSREENQLLRDQFDAIQKLDDEKEIDAWAAWSVEYPNHTPQEWRNHFKNVIAPAIEAKAVGKAPSNSRKERKLQGAEPADSPSTVEAQSISDLENSIVRDELLFKYHLTAISDDYEHIINFDTIIYGRELSLFRLWQVVKKEFGGIGSDDNENHQYWPKVARKLNFSLNQHPDVPELLHVFYDTNLLPDLEDFIKIYTKGANSQEKALIDSQLRQSLVVSKAVEEDEDMSEELEESTSPLGLIINSNPKRPGKRVLHINDFENVAQLGASHIKRSRIDKGKGKGIGEIPSTPEDVIRGNRPRSSFHTSPLKQMASVASPILGEEEEDDEEDNLDEIKPTFKRPFRQPNMSGFASLNNAIEPETQDFQFPQNQDAYSNRLSQSLASSLPRFIRQNEVPKAYLDTQDDASTHSQTEAEKKAIVDDFIKHYGILGYGEEIAASLRATTMELDLAEELIVRLGHDRNIPDDIEGVWTSADDEALKHGRGTDYIRVVRKHGTERVDLRQRFLKDQENDSDSS